MGTSQTPLLYRDLLKSVKESVTLIGFNPDDVGLHSLRRSGAAFLHSITSHCIGDWMSLAVLSYLITPPDRRLSLRCQRCEMRSILDYKHSVASLK